MESGENYIKIQEQPVNLPAGKFRSFMLDLEKILTKEIKEEDLARLWEEIKDICLNNSFMSEEIKISAAGLLLIASCWWVGQSGIIPAAHSEESSEITNAQETDKPDTSVLPQVAKPQGDEVKKVDTKAINEFKFKSPEDQCEEDKEQKKASNLCGKDDEEEIKRQAAERARELARMRPSSPRVVGRMPADFKVAGGRRVCSKSNDHPSKSDKNKGRHMDMECCLDPDEYPNPNCYYDPGKYGKYL